MDRQATTQINAKKAAKGLASPSAREVSMIPQGRNSAERTIWPLTWSRGLGRLDINLAGHGVILLEFFVFFPGKNRSGAR